MLLALAMLDFIIRLMLKSGSHLPNKVIFICFNVIFICFPLQNAFCFMLKALSVLKIFKFLS